MPFKYAPMIMLALLTSPAFAHVTANPNQGVAGSYFQTSFRITHGCEGSDTTSVRINIPEGVLSVHPQFKPGWEVTISQHKLPKPLPTGHGQTVDEAVDEVVWSGSLLPNDQYDDFGLIMKLPDTKGKTLWFPVVQGCKNGENKWVEMPAAGEEWHMLDAPAPFVKLITKQ